MFTAVGGGGIGGSAGGNGNLVILAFEGGADEDDVVKDIFSLCEISSSLFATTYCKFLRACGDDIVVMIDVVFVADDGVGGFDVGGDAMSG